ncbi:uracil phosphoribosyltransferase [Thecamonas trahens ATCC 50062]|uniref:uracil phosphoribosyltransferase n=1 Tax=Thecamonas trahens ATCC 50062 TaxID=461836 RepID=A0A0L0DE52_THETB|nr:uracil phosphoribosyltransferase [Thecamonas trahens ATCC 50062]KNC50510.1 uracil phosphoribosyltransferase [Thecamonas trahens ATCC 50062]|eukprot:XP_013762402.1 uracil phosphoribosyltransferase [Thecamonas trahens ATCC 50062]
MSAENSNKRPANGLPEGQPVAKKLRGLPETYVLPPNVIVMRETMQTRGMFTIIRDEKTTHQDFVFYFDRLSRLLIEEALSYLPAEEVDVMTPTGEAYPGIRWTRNLCGVPIIRAGEAFEIALRGILRDCVIGKILIQRDEETTLPKLFYSKLPKDISERTVLLLDPMLATGGSAKAAIQVLIDSGVAEDSIMFINLVSCPEGLQAIYEAYPKVCVVTGEVDRQLNERAYIMPGLGDAGDRYMGTE